MLFLTYLLLAWLGALAVVFFSLVSFSASTNSVNNLTTVKAWWSLNAFQTGFSIIVISLVSFLLTVPGGDWIIGVITGGKLDGSTPIGFYVTAIASGFVIQYGFDKWRGVKNPIQLDLRDVSLKTGIPKAEMTPPKDQ